MIKAKDTKSQIFTMETKPYSLSVNDHCIGPLSQTSTVLMKCVSLTVRDNVFAGIPVLFLPGNGGSYRQVRSLGSVSLRKSEDVGNKIWFDYFSVDFNSELSGLVGSLLLEQTQFVTRVVDHILRFYKGGWSHGVWPSGGTLLSRM